MLPVRMGWTPGFHDRYPTGQPGRVLARHMIMNVRAAAVAALTVSAAVLAGCSSGPPQASTLIKQIPGCPGHLVSTQVDVQAATEARCITAGGLDVTLATFPSSGERDSWIAQNGVACQTLRGDGWAAVVWPPGQDLCTPASVMKALGGQEVNP